MGSLRGVSLGVVVFTSSFVKPIKMREERASKPALLNGRSESRNVACGTGEVGFGVRVGVSGSLTAGGLRCLPGSDAASNLELLWRKDWIGVELPEMVNCVTNSAAPARSRRGLRGHDGHRPRPDGPMQGADGIGSNGQGRVGSWADAAHLAERASLVEAILSY